MIGLTWTEYTNLFCFHDDHAARYGYTHSISIYTLQIGATHGVPCSAIPCVAHAFVQSSDKRLEFNGKPLVNALDVTNRLEPVEYDQKARLN